MVSSTPLEGLLPSWLHTVGVALNGTGCDSTGLKLKLSQQDLSYFFAFGNINQEISESAERFS